MGDALDRDTLRLLHGRLLHGDRLASEELARAVLASLSGELRRKFRYADPHLVADGVIDAVIDYCARPQQYDAALGVPLDRFLAAAAGRNVLNLLRGERRRKDRERLVGRQRREADVGFDPVAGNICQEEREHLEAKRAAMLQALNDPRDRDILDLRLQGVRDTAPFARILGLTHLPPAEQRSEVRRRKDRIVRFLRRKGLLP